MLPWKNDGLKLCTNAFVMKYLTGASLILTGVDPYSIYMFMISFGKYIFDVD